MSFSLDFFVSRSQSPVGKGARAQSLPAGLASLKPREGAAGREIAS